MRRPYGAERLILAFFPTLKRGANDRCASGAIEIGTGPEHFRKMNIKLAQGKVHPRPKVVAQNEQNPSGAKAHVFFVAFMARLKSCPDTEPAMPIVFGEPPEQA